MMPPMVLRFPDFLSHQSQCI